MKPVKILLSALIVVLLVAGCGQKEAVEEFKSQWIKLKHKPIEKAVVGTDAPVRATIEVSEDIEAVRLFLYYTAGDAPQEVIQLEFLESGDYFAAIPSQKRGTQVEYYLEARAGRDLVVRVPKDIERPGFTFVYKGTPNQAILVTHLVLRFMALLLFLLCGFLAFRALTHRRVVVDIPRLGFLGTVIYFISSFPLGMIVDFQRYGKPWTGFPVSNGLGDNKSLIIVLYWLAASLLYRGSIFKRDPARDLLGRKPLPYIYLFGVLLVVLMYLLPK
jgi:hypothetical protein